MFSLTKHTVFHQGTSHLKPRRTTSVNHHSKSAIIKKDKYYEESLPQSSFDEFPSPYYYDVLQKSTPCEIGLQQHPVNDISDHCLRSNANHRKLPLTSGQQLLLLRKHNVNEGRQKKSFV